ncbi:uncharacterized protein LOC119979811 [Tripterygium wilfordii]|uniref:uncharacterized protein LOC119979811 n=1 Tax=Tripterygium wilfordii TaxID=458696 RepID=UPI0018F830E4|nr:uncharacterized protein LOC119979811 [Tripterygium wilfordii]
MAYKIPINERFGAKVLSFSKLYETISDIKSKLSEDQLTLFEGSCFESRFSIREFNLITGLRCHSLPDISLYLKEMENSGEPRVGLQYKYFNGSYHISCQELQRTFMQYQDPKDVFKLTLVYFAESVILGRDVKLLIDVDLLNLIDYLDMFNKFPWGTLSYKKIIQSLTNCLVGRSDKFKTKQNDYEWYNPLGFPWTFQLWWSSTKAPKSKIVNDILEADEYIFTLVTIFEMVNTHSESE